MAIVGMGTDIVDIRRLEKVLARTGVAFAQRILAPNEWLQFQQHKQQARFLAKRFAAKEAGAKALGTGIAQGVTFTDFIVSNNDAGKPLLTLSGKALELSVQQGVANIHISISDEKYYAVVTVIFES
ncbi:holo-ACP synthase [Motilimonas cestriensis]|uniref:Holo-[acyl-carrier-protein] synthase n=1 Tax=Motilimonas cestriensis TaxID=2742685 RepID=A0ABS8WGC3_9GAMM|nr:holo-ACP synthase [Motilimonas cestriensis]MCE2597330.1 holo-ACP synthase [Motilimonas cestriensis]